MTTLTEAIKLILGSVNRMQTEFVELGNALNRVLAEEIITPWDLPGIDNSAMDGYAVCSTECRADSTFKSAGFLGAGEGESPGLKSGEVIRIMTGAAIPAGADAVVPLEEAEEKEGRVVFNGPVKKGQHIRFKGEDILRGSVVASSGTLLRPSEISLLASLGKALVPVYRRPRTAIVATGDELKELGEVPVGAALINSNSIALAAAIREIGAEPVLIGIARDDIESHRRVLGSALSADVVITSAGVSSGDRDLVRDVLQELGVKQVFWKVAAKPGGPAAFGMKGNIPVFSLPGNPVSTLLTFEMLVRPALLKMMGHKRIFKTPFKAILAEDAKMNPEKTVMHRVRLYCKDGKWMATSSGDQKTGFLKTQVSADGIILIAPGSVNNKVGCEVDVLILGERQWLMEL